MTWRQDPRKHRADWIDKSPTTTFDRVLVIRCSSKIQGEDNVQVGTTSMKSDTAAVATRTKEECMIHIKRICEAVAKLASHKRKLDQRNFDLS